VSFVFISEKPPLFQPKKLYVPSQLVYNEKRKSMEGLHMAKESSFDIVSKVDMSEVSNAIQIALKEVQTRYDFKGSKSDIKLDGEEIVLVSDDEFKMNQLKDVLLSKLIKRNVPVKNLDYSKLEGASGGTVRQRAKLVQGIDKDNAKKINTIIKNSGVKVKSQVQDDQVRVTGKSKDDLQKIIAAIREADLSIDVQYVNFR
jgi:cyclic-di-GMP-binding protein